MVTCLWGRTKRRNWLRTTCRPLVTASGSVVGTLGVDIDMNDVVVERNRFLNKSISFVLGITAAVMIVSMLAMRHLATRPLKELAKAATKFGRDDDALSKKDILKLDIRSNDEIGDLYREIQSMQRRIVDYMENLARITAERERVRTELSMAENLQSFFLFRAGRMLPACISQYHRVPVRAVPPT